MATPDVPEAGYTELRDAIAETIPNAMFASPVVGIGGARRQKVADYAMRAVLPALAAARADERARVLDEVQAALRDRDGYVAWERARIPKSSVDYHVMTSDRRLCADYLRDTVGAGGEG